MPRASRGAGGARPVRQGWGERERAPQGASGGQTAHRVASGVLLPSATLRCVATLPARATPQGGMHAGGVAMGSHGRLC